MYKIVDSWLNTRKTQTSELLHKNCLIYDLIFLMKYINICQKWLNFFHLISTFSGFPTFHILSIFANFFRIQIFWSFYLHKFHVSYIHTICLFSPTFWTRTGTYGLSKSLILTVFRMRFCIHFPLTKYEICLHNFASIISFLGRHFKNLVIFQKSTFFFKFVY